MLCDSCDDATARIECPRYARVPRDQLASDARFWFWGSRLTSARRDRRSSKRPTRSSINRWPRGPTDQQNTSPPRPVRARRRRRARAGVSGSTVDALRPPTMQPLENALGLELRRRRPGAISRAMSSSAYRADGRQPLAASGTVGPNAGVQRRAAACRRGISSREVGGSSRRRMSHARAFF